VPWECTYGEVSFVCCGKSCAGVNICAFVGWFGGIFEQAWFGSSSGSIVVVIVVAVVAVLE